MSHGKKKEDRRPPELLANAWPFVLEAVFLAAFFLCRESVEAEGVMPEALAILTVIAFDLVAAYLKLWAVRHREQNGALSPLPSLWLAVVVIFALRVEGTGVTEAALDELRRAMPSTRFEL